MKTGQRGRVNRGTVKNSAGGAGAQALGPDSLSSDLGSIPYHWVISSKFL